MRGERKDLEREAEAGGGAGVGGMTGYLAPG